MPAATPIPRNDIDDLRLALVALERQELHEGHASRRALTDDYEIIGLVGEREAARVLGVAMDLAARPCGDKGIDLVLPNGLTIDVKTARKPYNLPHPEGKVVADIYLLAKYYDEGMIGRAALLGWEWGHVLAQAPTRDFGSGIMNHCIARDRLLPIDQLIGLGR